MTIEVKKTNRRLIEIGKYGKFEVYGYKPWTVHPVAEEGPHRPAGWIISDIPAGFMAPRPHMFNSLVKILDNGAKIPVLFTTANGNAMAEEICFIINNKL